MNTVLYGFSNEDEIAAVVTPPLFSRTRPPVSPSPNNSNSLLPNAMNHHSGDRTSNLPPSSSSNSESNNSSRPKQKRSYSVNNGSFTDNNNNGNGISDVSSKIFDSQCEIDPNGSFSLEWLEHALEDAYNLSTHGEEKEESPVSPSSDESFRSRSVSRSPSPPDERDSPERVRLGNDSSMVLTSNFKFKGHRRIRSFSCDGRDESKHLGRLYSTPPTKQKHSPPLPLLPFSDLSSSPPSSTKKQDLQEHHFQTPPLRKQRIKRKKQKTPPTPPTPNRTPPLPNKHLLPKPIRRVQSDTLSSKSKKKKTSVKNLYEQAARALQQSDHVKALQLSEKILRKEERRHGYHNASVATALHNVAMVHLHAKRYEEAESVLCEAIVLRKQTLGPHHKDVAASSVKLGHVYTKLKKHDSAVKSFKAALHISRDHHDDQQIQSAQVLSHIGCLYYDAKELMAAQATFCDALALYRQKGEQRSVSETLCNVGSIQLKRKNLKDAIDSFSEALGLQRRIWGDNNSRVIATLDNLGYANSKNKDYKQALFYYKEMLRSQLDYYGKFNKACSDTVKKQNLMTNKLNQQ
eukprot:CAMPEP_0195283704 /NCGR_PEP_ID=MMETSP0707-20130614/2162_1 /TAXON_ID=33640 /ORGANISM="Asterionellopsis glacialis, Strain CCMP134" /LENGTH=575 /DNA_ID=CAMNT_0040342921 /DNA_START=79 /DNA_END=1806 /DNA_ORIENTATION=-